MFAWAINLSLRSMSTTTIWNWKTGPLKLLSLARLTSLYSTNVCAKFVSIQQHYQHYFVNARFGWLQTANAGLFVVLNLVRDTDWNDPLDNQIFSIKYSYQFDVL